MELAPQNIPQIAEWIAQQLPHSKEWAEQLIKWGEEQISRITVMPQRIILCIFGCLAIVNAYTMRLCLDVAMSHIVAPKKTQNTMLRFFNTSASPTRSLNIYDRMQDHKSFASRGYTEKVDDTRYNWSEQLQTIMLISFYTGYVITHVPGAQLAERYGGKWVLAVGIAVTAVLTILTPCAIRWGGPIALILVRVLIGLSEGPTFPAIGALLSKWVPAKERGTLGAFVLSGSQMGISALNFLSGLLLQKFDWSLIFYYFGGCALLWFVAFTTLCYNNPETNPFIKEAEKQYLKEEIGAVRTNSKDTTTPWKDIFRSLPVWGLIAATVQYDWTQLQNVAELPQTIKDIEQLTLSESLVSAMNNAIPYFINWLLSVFSGVMSDFLVNYEILSVTVTRKIMAFIAAAAPNLYTALLPCCNCKDKSKDILAFFDCAISVLGTYYAGIKLTPLDMSPNFAATLMAIANGCGSMTGIISPYLKNVLGKSPYFKSIRSFLWLISALLISGEVQPFNEANVTTNKDE